MAFIERTGMIEASPLPGWSGRFFHSTTMSFAHWTIDPDASDLHEHHHPQEEVWNVVEGEAVLVVAGEEHRVQAGDAAVVPPNVPHSVKVVGGCRAIVVDHPTRPSIPGVRRT